MNHPQDTSCAKILPQAATPDSLDVLDALLADCKVKPAGTKQAAVLFSLEDLLADSMKLKRDGEGAKLARALLAKGGLEVEARMRMQADVRAYELKVEWRSLSAVAIFRRQWCDACGLCHIQFVGYFQRQKHRNSKIDRWVKSTAQGMEGLPKETKYEEEAVEICEECAALAGYPIDDYNAEAEGE